MVPTLPRNLPGHEYLTALSDFSICTTGKQVPTGPDWLHEVKYDGYRMMLHRDGDRVPLLTKGGHDGSSRYPFIVETALRLREKQFVIDGEAVVLDVRGFSDFGALHSRKHDHEVQLYAFDLLALGGDDIRQLPLHLRKTNKTNLARLLARRPEGIFVAPFEQGEIGVELFRAACDMGLEGMVSKRRDRPYHTGRCAHWIKNKNRRHPAFARVKEQF